MGKTNRTMPERVRGETCSDITTSRWRPGGVRMPSDFDPTAAAPGDVKTYRQRAVPVDAVGVPGRRGQVRDRPPRVNIGKTTKLTLTRSAGEHLGAPKVDVRYSPRTRQLWLIGADDERHPRLSTHGSSGRSSPSVCCSGMLRLLREQVGIAPGRYPAEPVLTQDGRKALVVQFPEARG